VTGFCHFGTIEKGEYSNRREINPDFLMNRGEEEIRKANEDNDK
jgi:hypothetical protein